MTIEIVEGGLNDLERLVELNHSIFKGMYEREPFSLEEYRKRLERREPFIYIAKLNGQIIGDSVSYGMNDSFYVWVLGVEKAQRQMGIGWKLLEMNEAAAIQRRLAEITTKAYNVYPEMQRLLIKRRYQITGVDISETDSRFNAVHFRLEL